MIFANFVQVFRTLVENTKGIKGAKVENHKFCASVHYRNVDEKVPDYFFLIAQITNITAYISLLAYMFGWITVIKNNARVWLTFGWFWLLIWLQNWSTIAQRVHDVLKDYPRLRLTHGRKVITSFPFVFNSIDR